MISQIEKNLSAKSVDENLVWFWLVQVRDYEEKEGVILPMLNTKPSLGKYHGRIGVGIVDLSTVFINTGVKIVDSKSIGVLSNNDQSPWLKRLAEVLGSLGTVTIFSEGAFSEDVGRRFDLLVVDTSGLQMELAERVGWLHGRFPTVPIVVLTSSPTWRRARAVLQAGASDYMRRSMEDDMLLERCRSLIAWSP